MSAVTKMFDGYDNHINGGVESMKKKMENLNPTIGMMNICYNI